MRWGAGTRISAAAQPGRLNPSRLSLDVRHKSHEDAGVVAQHKLVSAEAAQMAPVAARRRWWPRTTARSTHRTRTRPSSPRTTARRPRGAGRRAGARRCRRRRRAPGPGRRHRGAARHEAHEAVGRRASPAQPAGVRARDLELLRPVPGRAPARARRGKIRGGATARPAPTAPKGDVVVLPLRMPRFEVAELDKVWRGLGFSSRTAFLRRAMTEYVGLRAVEG